MNRLLSLLALFISVVVEAQEPIDSALYFYDTNGLVLNEGEHVNILGEPCIVLRSNRNQDGLVMSMHWRPATKEKGKACYSWAHHPALGMMNSNIPPIDHNVGLNDSIAGLNNFLRLKRLLDSQMLYKMEHYHAFNTCSTMGNGWYLPSKGELHLLYDALDIKPYFDKKAILAKVNEFRKDCGLKKIKSIFLWSSTEGDDNVDWVHSLKIWILTHKSTECVQVFLFEGRADNNAVAPVHLVLPVFSNDSATASEP